MPGAIQRNAVVKFFGTPDSTEGTVNEPRERQENGLLFNEKWVYRRPRHDPARAVERVVYWRRYDFVGSVIRRAPEGDWQADPELAAFLASS